MWVNVNSTTLIIKHRNQCVPQQQVILASVPVLPRGMWRRERVGSVEMMMMMMMMMMMIMLMMMMMTTTTTTTTTTMLRRRRKRRT